MSALTCIETSVDQNQTNSGTFVIEPLELGQGITLGNALRRTILSDLSSYAISGVRINNLKHEFSMIEGLKEDVLELLLNLKEIIFKSSFSIHQKKALSKFSGFLNIQGPTIVTAGMFNLPKNYLTIVNPNLYLCTLVDDSELYIEIDIENGKGYKFSEELRRQKKEKNIFSLKNPSTLYVDAFFMPIKKVNYKIKLIHDTKGNIKESLILEIVTNGSITPKRSVQEALKILLNLFYSIFLNKDFFNLSSNFNKENFS